MEKSMISKTSAKFRIYGGQFIPETLMPAIEELTAGYAKYRDDPISPSKC
jgi:tryptophan synthase beta subunit